MLGIKTEQSDFRQLSHGNEFPFHPKSIDIAVTTYYPAWYEGKVKSLGDVDKIRGDLALAFIAKANASGMRIVVVDGKSSLTFRNKLRRLKGVQTFLRTGYKRSSARRMAIEKIAGIDGVNCIIVTEPEKLLLLDTDCLSHIVKPILTNEAVIVVPKRKGKCFQETYPEFQYKSERLGNNMIHKMLKRYDVYNGYTVYDFFFGPSLFRNDPRIVALYQHIFSLRLHRKAVPKEYLDPEEFSDTLFFPPILGLAKGYRVQSITIPFLYPVIQKQNEEMDAKEVFLEKRRNQRFGILMQIRHLLLFLAHDKRSKLIQINP